MSIINEGNSYFLCSSTHITMAQPRSPINVTHFVFFYDRRLQERLEMHGVDYHTAAAVAAAQELSACEKV
jgi:hypothetical protein